MSRRIRNVVAAVALVAAGFATGATWSPDGSAPSEPGSGATDDVPVVQPAAPGDPSCGGGQPTDADRSLT